MIFALTAAVPILHQAKHAIPLSLDTPFDNILEHDPANDAQFNNVLFSNVVISQILPSINSFDNYLFSNVPQAMLHLARFRSARFHPRWTHSTTVPWIVPPALQPSKVRSARFCLLTIYSKMICRAMSRLKYSTQHWFAQPCSARPRSAQHSSIQHSPAPRCPTKWCVAEH